MPNKSEVPLAFWERADAIICLANAQCRSELPPAVSSSMMYATSRFNSFIIARDCPSKDDLVSRRQEAIDYFMVQYRKMLEDNFDDQIANFEYYISSKDQDSGPRC